MLLTLEEYQKLTLHTKSALGTVQFLQSILNIQTNIYIYIYIPLGFNSKDYVQFR